MATYPHAFASFAVAASLAPAVPAQYLQWTVEPGTQRWYGLTPAAAWADAELIAQSQGAHLATIGDAAEQAFVAGQIGPLAPVPVWIGLNDEAVEGSFVWVDGSPAGYTSWAPGQPDGGDAVLLWPYAGWAWHDAAPSAQWPGLVERGPRPLVGFSFPRFDATGSFPLHVEPGDFDGDGRADVVVANFQSRSLSAFRNQGDGTLSAPITSQVPVGLLAWSVALGQLSGGPALDAAVAMYDALVLLEGDGSGGFTAVSTLPAPQQVVTIVAQDFDGDGRADLALTSLTGSLAILRAVPPAGFVAAGSYATPADPQALSVGDVDGDGDTDLVVTGNQGGGVAVYRNDGAGGFTPLPIVPTTGYAGRVAIADLDGDGHADLAVPLNQHTRVWWGFGDGTFDVQGPSFATSGNGGWAEAADIDGDGRFDLAITGEQGRTVDVLLSRPGRVLQPVAKLHFAEWAQGVRALQLGGDARPELVAIDRNRDAIATFTNVTLDCNTNAVDDATEILLDPALDADHDGLLDACADVGVPLCFGDGSGTPCPCAPGQTGAPGRGCATSAGGGGRLRASGSASVAADTVRLRAGDLTPTSMGLFFQGDATVAGGAGAAFGDGLRCVTQSVVRLAIRPIVLGQASLGYGIPGDPSLAASGAVPPAGGTRYYQLWFRDAQSFCTSATFNLSNALRIDWGA